MIETLRSGGERQTFAFRDRGSYWESVGIIPEPHAFEARVQLHHAEGPFTVDLSYPEPEGHEHHHAHQPRVRSTRALIGSANGWCVHVRYPGAGLQRPRGTGL